VTLLKVCPARLKAVGADDGLADGQFEAIVSVFGNKDSYGDIVIPGAFTDTLAAWAASGDPIPSYWSHRMDDPDYNIGQVLEAKELLPGDPMLPEAIRENGGLWARVQLDLDGGKAPQVYRLLKGRRVTQFSFAYDIVEGGMGQSKREDGSDDYFYELRKLALYELGPTPIGANQETELLGVKSMPIVAGHLLTEIKAGRVLAQRHIDSLRSAQDAIGTVITAAEATNDDEKASTSGTAKTEEPPGAKAEEPARDVSADLSALKSIELSALAD